MFFRKESIRLRDELEQFVGVNNEEPPVFDLMQRSIACTFRVIVCTYSGFSFITIFFLHLYFLISIFVFFSL